jgi:inorganic pyrophosphatase
MLKLNVIIEIPKGSNLKYEYDRKTKKISIDRKLDENDVYPQAYGFIPEALDYDGDELDILVFSTKEFKPGSHTSINVIGAMEMIDDGETDTKLLGVDLSDHKFQKISDLKELPKKMLEEIKYFFETYKRFRNQTVIVKGFKDANFANNEYLECVGLMKQYGSLDKKKFIELMKQKYPEKYN